MGAITRSRYIETRLANNELVRVEVATDEAGRVKELLEKHVKSLLVSPVHQTTVGHGCYSLPSRYQITQHHYAASMHSYIEVLEIHDPPDGRWPIVVNGYRPTSGSNFTEWETLADAHKAFNCTTVYIDKETIAKLPGFKRRVECPGPLPWFYAVGNDELMGDYAAPYRMQDDPVYRIGRQFVVTDDDGMPSVKTCLGSHIYTTKDRFSHEEHRRHIVYWDDGSTWTDRTSNNPPRPLEEGELWIAEAITQFRKMLAGKSLDFTIPFLNGARFIGKLMLPKHRKNDVAGKYFITVRLEGKKNALEGWVDFSPTEALPDLLSFVRHGMREKHGKEVESMKIKQAKKGKKWSGVLLPPPHAIEQGE